MKVDYAYEQTDKILEELEKKLKKEYGQAVREVEKKMNDYMRRFVKKDKTWQEWVKAGKKTQAEYIKWRQGQMIAGKRWAELKDKLARDYSNTNQIARKIVNNDIKDVYALNMNYATYQIETGLGVDTSFALYNHDAVERLMSQDPDMLPPPGEQLSERIRLGKDVRWNKQQIQSVMTQGIMQGESIPKLAHRLAQTVGDSNYKAAIRNARTMTTGAQNAARDDATQRAIELGCLVDVYWVAVHDNRTRTSHRHMDGEKRGEDGYYSNGCRFPGDPQCDDASEVYNCRCAYKTIPTGFEKSFGIGEKPEIMGMPYDEWMDAKPVYKPIDGKKKKKKATKKKHTNE